MIKLNKILKQAKKEKINFEKFTSDINYENKGILFSEMFFLFLCIDQLKTNRIIETFTHL